jgi:uncharacterized protein (TIGR00290 family)
MASARVILSWSGGKDSALALQRLRTDGYTAITLLTTVSAEYRRISMHGVRIELLERQARALGCPLEIVWLPTAADHAAYETQMGATLLRLQAAGHTAVAFGDLFLQDLRAYREAKLGEIGMPALFPVWGQATDRLAREFIDLGFRAVVTCVDGHALDGSFCGRLYDHAFLADLPREVDPCGENGEFHTFAYAGPIFTRPVAWERGAVVARDKRFHFCDLLGREIAE